jgi:hypothetical protein
MQQVNCFNRLFSTYSIIKAEEHLFFPKLIKFRKDLGIISKDLRK